MTTTSNSLDTQKEVRLKSINIAYSALNTFPPKQFNGFSEHNLRDGVLFSRYLNAAALTPVPLQNPSCSTHCLKNYKTEIWVGHSYQPKSGPSESYRLQHIAQTLTGDTNTTFVIFFEEQTYDTNLNTCICQTFFPELVLNW